MNLLKYNNTIINLAQVTTMELYWSNSITVIFEKGNKITISFNNTEEKENFLKKLEKYCINLDENIHEQKI